MKIIDNIKRYNEAKCRQDINVDSEIRGLNDKIENDIVIQNPYKYIDNYLIELIYKKKHNLKLLDYCCGTGLRSITAVKSGYECYGVDISQKSILIARKRLSAYNSTIPNNYIVGNAEKLDYRNDYFDVIISYGSFSYLDFDAALSEIIRVLKSDGIFIILDTTKNNIFINLKRYIKYKYNIVTKYHIDNLFDMDKINMLEHNYFKSFHTSYFHLLSIYTIPLPDYAFFKKLKTLTLLLDNFLQKTPLKCFFWKFVIILKHPIK